MGLEKRSTAFRLSEDTLNELAAIQKAFSPFAEDRSSTLRIVIRVLYSILFTPATLNEILMVCQRLQSVTSQYDGQMQFRFPGQVSLTPRFGRLQ